MTCKMTITTKQVTWQAHFLHQPPWQFAQKPSWESASCPTAVGLLLQLWSQTELVKEQGVWF